MTDQPIGPKPLPDDLVRAMKTFAITNGPQNAEGARPMTDAERIKELEARVAELDAEAIGLTVDLCQLLDVLRIDGHDGSHLEDDGGGQSECAVCATMSAIRARLRGADL